MSLVLGLFTMPQYHIHCWTLIGWETRSRAHEKSGELLPKHKNALDVSAQVRIRHSGSIYSCTRISRWWSTPYVKLPLTRKTSCVNARGIPSARGRKMLTPPPLTDPPSWTWPPPGWLDLTPPPPPAGPDPPRRLTDLTPPPAGPDPPQVWTDKQSETITFLSYYVRGQ